MFGLFNSVAELVSDTVKVVSAPFQGVVELADSVVKPIAEAAQELVEDIKSIKD